ncbi:semaphorin-5B-like, partial [Saccoglossus kowalevskii]
DLGATSACTSLPCKHNSWCTAPDEQQYVCTCRVEEMFEGDTCETYVAEPTPTITMQNWQPWSSDCTAQCDGGRHVRVRSCVPESLHCNDIEYKECNTQPCPVWSRWSETTYSLSTMTGTRQRVCLYDGLAGISPGCEGQNTETVDYQQ